MTMRSRRGRHRFGSPDLCYCGDRPEIRARLDGPARTRHASGAGNWRVQPAYAVAAALVTLGTVTLVTTGTALAQLLP